MPKVKAIDIQPNKHYWLNGHLRYITRVKILHGRRVRVEHGGGVSFLNDSSEVTAL